MDPQNERFSIVWQGLYNEELFRGGVLGAEGKSGMLVSPGNSTVHCNLAFRGAEPHCVAQGCAPKTLHTQVTSLLSLSPSLRSSWVPFTDACWQVFFSILKVTGSLQELDLSRNFVSCSIIQSLREDLKCPHCHLDTLR